MTKRKVSTSPPELPSFITCFVNRLEQVEKRRRMTNPVSKKWTFPDSFPHQHMLLCKPGILSLQPGARSSLDMSLEEHFSWDGRDAMLIASKRWRDRQEEMMLEGKSLETGCLKRFLAVGGDVFALIQLHKGVHSMSESQNKKVWMIAEALARITLYFIRSPVFEKFKAIFPPKAYRKFQAGVFEEVLKFALSIYDLEDFERMMNSEMLVSECGSFSTKLSELKNDCYQLARGNLDVSNLSHMKEHDLGYLLSLSVRVGHHEMCYLEGSPIFLSLQEPVTSFDVIFAMQAMQKYVPLKEECRMQLNLEMLRGKSFYVLDTLFLEVWKNIRFDKFCTKLGHASETTLFEGFHAIYTCLSNLVSTKQYMVQQFSREVIFPLSYGVFGQCSDEVIDAITAADYERRIRGHQFISAYHILCAFLGTWIAPVCKAMIIDREGSTGPVLSLYNIQKISAYKVYKTSNDVARNCGSKSIELGHLLVGIVVLQGRCNSRLCRQPHQVEDCNWRDRLLSMMVQNCSSSFWKEMRCYPKWRDPDIWSEFLPADCLNGDLLNCCFVYVVMKLYDALGRGCFSLPAVRI